MLGKDTKVYRTDEAQAERKHKKLLGLGLFFAFLTATTYLMREKYEDVDFTFSHTSENSLSMSNE